jgi:hypothetical protein
MSLQLRYTIVVLGTSAVAIAVGIGLLIWAYRQTGKSAGKSKEYKLAAGNILIAVFTALGSAFGVDVFKLGEGDKNPLAAVSPMSAQLFELTSSSQCLDHWYLSPNIWHYSLTRAGDSSVWQVGQPAFTRQPPDRITGHGVWLNTTSDSPTTYYIEAGCRGNRGILIFTENATGPDVIPTIEVYPELPDNQQSQIIGYAIDRTWDEHEVLAPVLISHQPLHGSEKIGPIKDPAVNKRISDTWRKLYAQTAKVHECTVCTTLSGVP